MNDHTETKELIVNLQSAVSDLTTMADEVGHARQVKEFSSERRKNLLAKYVCRYNASSAALREYLARNNEEYLGELSVLEAEHGAAEKIISNFQAAVCRYEAARSVLSFSRTVMDNLQG